jgi:hypothetical protein
MITTQLRADVILPTGLAPGSQYEIAFVTSDGTTATSSNIADYNNFVTSEANQDPILASLGVSWNAIASTTTVNANVNAPNNGSIPVYNTLGQLVTSSTGPSIYVQDYVDDVLLVPLEENQYGTVYTNGIVWTGSTARGLASLYPMGNQGPFYSGYTEWGYAGMCNSYWFSDTTWPETQLEPLYALSSPITVVPEPATLTHLASALLGLGLLYLRRRISKA